MAYFKDFDKRPKEFKTQADDGRMLMVLKKVAEPKKKEPKQPFGGLNDKNVRDAVIWIAKTGIVDALSKLDRAKDKNSKEEALADLERATRSLREAVMFDDASPFAKLKANPQRTSNQKAAEAAKWLDKNADKLVFYFEGYGGKGAIFSTDKKFVDAREKGRAFLMTKDEAAGIVQVLLDTGLWGRSDAPHPSIPFPARRIGLHAQGGGGDGGGIWTLGGIEDDVSSLLIVKHLLAAFDGERREAVNKWLKEGLEKNRH